jgi:argininosuccinate lyase
MRRFNDSLAFDRRLYAVDITGSQAYARALSAAGVITPAECAQLEAGLDQVRGELDGGTFSFEAGDEDIHTAVERRLVELVGAVGGKLHTGRSRNDQVATDLRLYLLQQQVWLHKALLALQEGLVNQAEEHMGVIMPGYTHLQQAQPLLFSHWLLSFFWKFQRDRERLEQVAERTAVLPLGAGALAGNPFAIDREQLSADLGFRHVCENSLDAVSDRDFAVEFVAWAALLQVHLSGLAEDLMLWTSREFGFVELDERYATGSSLMPQKKNPDSLELMRGKTGRMAGHLMALLTVLKGLPSGYNKDLQEDKEAIFDALDTLALELPIAAGVLCTLRVNAERMAEALDQGLLATDLSDYLVRKGVPFRESHRLVGQAVRRAEDLGVALGRMELQQYKDIHPLFGADLYQVLSFERSLERRAVSGGTAPAAVSAQLQRARALLRR